MWPSTVDFGGLVKLIAGSAWAGRLYRLNHDPVLKALLALCDSSRLGSARVLTVAL